MNLNISNRRKGVSPVIAVVLLIALTVAAAAAIYLIVMPLLNPTPSLDSQAAAEYYSANDVVVLELKANQGAVVITEISVANTTDTIVETEVWWGVGSATTVPSADEVAASVSVDDSSVVYIAIVLENGYVSGDYTFDVTYTADGSTLHTVIEISIVVPT